jgi:hypothetical protein
MRDFGVVILRSAGTPEHAALARRAWESVRRHHPGVPVLIVDDGSTVDLDVDMLFAGDTHVVRNEPHCRGAAEITPYYHLRRLRPFRWALVLHDSMLLRAPLPASVLDGSACGQGGQGGQGVACLWHFDPRIGHEAAAIEPLLATLGCADELIALSRRAGVAAPGHEGWHGCFGTAALVSLDALDRLEATYRWPSAHLGTVRGRSLRSAEERILALVAAHAGLLSPASLQGDIFLHPGGAFTNSSYARALAMCAGRSDSADAPAVLKTWHTR